MPRRFRTIVSALLAALPLAGFSACDPPPSADIPDGAFGPPDPYDPPQTYWGPCTLVGCFSEVELLVHIDAPLGEVVSFGAARVCHQAQCWDLGFLLTDPTHGQCDRHAGSPRGCTLVPEGEGTRMDLHVAADGIHGKGPGAFVDGDFASLRVEVGGRVVSSYVGHLVYADVFPNGRHCGGHCRSATLDVPAVAEAVTPPKP